MLDDLGAELCHHADPLRLSLLGHSHVALAFHRPEGSPAAGAVRRAGTVEDLSAGEWLLNPGSVGQPRDRDPRAAWLELDTERWSATFHRVAYDIDRAAAAIAASDLPEHLGRRLYVGQ